MARVPRKYQEGEIARLLNGKRPEQQCVNHAEDGGIGADAQGECHNDNNSKARRFA